MLRSCYLGGFFECSVNYYNSLAVEGWLFASTFALFGILVAKLAILEYFFPGKSAVRFITKK